MNTSKITEIRYFRHLLPKLRRFLLSKSKFPELNLKSMPELNDFIFGLRKKELTIIAARPSEGKSTFASQVAIDLASQGHLVLFLSLEMTEEKIGARLFCYQQRFNNKNAFRGGVSANVQSFDDFEKQVAGYPLIINDILGKNWQEIDELITSTDLNPEVIIVDYIQASSRTQARNRLDEVNEYIRHFRELAIRKNFAGIICSQINRTVHDEKNKCPQLHQMKESGFLEEHADLALLLHWPYKHNEGQLNRFVVFVAKNKDGRTGYVTLKFEPEFYSFSDWDELDNKLLKPAQNVDWSD